jgi:hypothetical protein
MSKEQSAINVGTKQKSHWNLQDFKLLTHSQ